jgi:hypothetical protein
MIGAWKRLLMPRNMNETGRYLNTAEEHTSLSFGTPARKEPNKDVVSRVDHPYKYKFSASFENIINNSGKRSRYESFETGN